MPFLTEEIWEKLTGRPATLDRVALSAAGTRRGAIWRPRPRSNGCGLSLRGSATSGGSAAVSPTEPVVLSVEPGSAREVAEIRDARAAPPAPRPPGVSGSEPRRTARERDVVAGVPDRAVACPAPRRARTASRWTRTLAQLDGGDWRSLGEAPEPRLPREGAAAGRRQGPPPPVSSWSSEGRPWAVRRPNDRAARVIHSPTGVSTRGAGASSRTWPASLRSVRRTTSRAR